MTDQKQDTTAVAVVSGSEPRPAGQSTTCGVCGETIVTPSRPLYVKPDGTEFGAIIDMDAHWSDYVQHYAERHPDVELPARFW